MAITGDKDLINKVLDNLAKKEGPTGDWAKVLGSSIFKGALFDMPVYQVPKDQTEQDPETGEIIIKSGKNLTKITNIGVEPQDNEGKAIPKYTLNGKQYDSLNATQAAKEHIKEYSMQDIKTANIMAQSSFADQIDFSGALPELLAMYKGAGIEAQVVQQLHDSYVLDVKSPKPISQESWDAMQPIQSDQIFYTSEEVWEFANISLAEDGEDGPLILRADIKVHDHNSWKQGYKWEFVSEKQLDEEARKRLYAEYFKM